MHDGRQLLSGAPPNQQAAFAETVLHATLPPKIGYAVEQPMLDNVAGRSR